MGTSITMAATVTHPLDGATHVRCLDASACSRRLTAGRVYPVIKPVTVNHYGTGWITIRDNQGEGTWWVRRFEAVTVEAATVEAATVEAATVEAAMVVPTFRVGDRVVAVDFAGVTGKKLEQRVYTVTKVSSLVMNAHTLLTLDDEAGTVAYARRFMKVTSVEPDVKPGGEAPVPGSFPARTTMRLEDRDGDRLFIGPSNTDRELLVTVAEGVNDGRRAASVYLDRETARQLRDELSVYLREEPQAGETAGKLRRALLGRIEEVQSALREATSRLAYAEAKHRVTDGRLGDTERKLSVAQAKLRAARRHLAAMREALVERAAVAARVLDEIKE